MAAVAMSPRSKVSENIVPPDPPRRVVVKTAIVSGKLITVGGVDGWSGWVLLLVVLMAGVGGFPALPDDGGPGNRRRQTVPPALPDAPITEFRSQLSRRPSSLVRVPLQILVHDHCFTESTNGIKNRQSMWLLIDKPHGMVLN